MITLQVGQIFTETPSPGEAAIRIEILEVDDGEVHYKASGGLRTSYRMAYSRFEGLIKGGVFVPSPVASPTEIQRQTIRKLECENLALKQKLEKILRQLTFIAERNKL